MVKDEVYQSVLYFPKQCEQAWEETKNINFGQFDPANIAICGMGASAYGYYTLISLFANQIKKPVTLVNGYQLPEFVDQNTLLIISSFSGNTEECIEVYKQAVERKCHIVLISSGGEFKNIADRDKVNSYIFANNWNPANQPRMACGYTLFSLLGVLRNLKLIQLSDTEVVDAIKLINTYSSQLDTNTSFQELLKKVTNKQILILAAEHLSGNAHIFRNQLNETSKVFSVYSLIPETNHHLLEGLGHPSENKELLSVISFHSKLYYTRNQKRFLLTEQISVQNGLDVNIIEVEGSNTLEQVLWTILVSSYLSYQLALINKEDPKKIEWVDYFKKQLSA